MKRRFQSDKAGNAKLARAMLATHNARQAAKRAALLAKLKRDRCKDQ